MSPFLSKRYTVLTSFFWMGFVVLGLRFLYLGFHRYQWDPFVRSARQRVKILPALRGGILDCRGRRLVLQQRVYEVGVDLTQIQEKDQKQLPQLAVLLDRPLHELEAFWTKSACRWKLLKKEVTESQYKKMQALRIKGVYGNEKPQRRYLHAPSLSYIVGFLNQENQPVCGMERMMQFYLKGQNGFVSYEVNGKNDEMRQYRKEQIDAVDGYTVELTLDDHIQSLVEQILLSAKKRLRAQSLQALITRPSTGEVLACVSVPFFDSNDYRQYKVEDFTNRSFSHVYEPGSVFKAITVASALDCNAIQPTDRFNCGVSVASYRGKELPLPKDWKTFDQVMDVHEILSHSSNRGTVQIAFQLGAERLHEYGERFGFGHSTCSGFAGETSGIFHPLKHWDGLTITRLPMGHSLACSIFQMHYAMGVIANGGRLMYPQFVKRIYHPQGEIVRSFDPMVRRVVLKPSTTETVRKMLLLNNHSKAFLPHYFVAGKTGTSQKIINGRYSHSHHIASVSGFFPYQHPQLQITVVVDDAQVAGIGYGEVVASPVFQEIAKALISYLGMPPEPKTL